MDTQAPAYKARSSSIARVMVVDDEPIIASTIAAILKLSGFETRFFVDPLDALDAIKTFKPDVLLSDVMMPGLSGIELAIRLKEACPTCKVLLFSGGYRALDLVQRALSYGHDFQLLSKPCHPKTLVDRVKSMLGDAGAPFAVVAPTEPVSDS